MGDFKYNAEIEKKVKNVFILSVTIEKSLIFMKKIGKREKILMVSLT